LNGTDIDIGKKYGFDKINAVLAGFVFLFTFTVFYMTKAPSFSFWDCGEFVACSYILGIPHPPGSPLYIILGRVFSVLPIASDIAVRVNLLSVTSSAAAAMFGYLVAVRLIRFWFKERKNIYDRLVVYIGGLTGALFMAFSNTNWSNSVEAEVYAATMTFMLLIYWLALKYFDEKETPAGSKYLLLLAYLAMLGVGIHLTIFAIIPVIGLFFVLKKGAGSREWIAVALFFITELYLLFHMSSRPGEVAYYIPILVFFILYLFHAIFLSKMTRQVKIALGLYIVALYPLYFIIFDAFVKNVSGSQATNLAGSVGSLPIGWLGFAGLIIWGLYCLVNYLKYRSQGDEADKWLMPGVYSLLPGVLFGIGSVLSGYHAYLVVSGLITVGLVLILWRHINWLVLIGIGAISLIILGFWQMVWGVAIGGLAIIIIGLKYKDGSWKTAIAIILLGILGFTIHVFIPIRSAQNPAIDENNPSRSFAAVVGYLERKQYGTESMVERMFVRRAEWKNQFGDHRRMGFWHFFKEQYGAHGRRFFIMFILGLFGIWETIRRKPDIGLPFFIVIILCCLGIVLYMNFADGTRIQPVTGGDYLEVRDRDYFFTPGFVFFGLAIGLGIAGFIDLVRDTFRNFGPTVQTAAFGISSLLVLMPIIPLRTNYFYNDRSRNFIAYDYANNYFKSCGKDAILITNGDNDTFPTWCVQEVYGVRRDVRVVNLSLANTDWYIKQLRDKLHLPIGWTDAQIGALRPYVGQDNSRHRLQDQLLDHLIYNNNWKVPIVFAVTVSEDNRRYRGKSIEDLLVLEGMVYRLSKKQGKDQLNFDLTEKLYEHEYSYRGVSDSTIYKSESTRRLINNYAQGFLVLADSLRKAKDYEGAMVHVRRGLKLLPDSFDIYAYAAQLLGEMGRLDTLETFVNEAPIQDKKLLYFNWAISARMSGRQGDAIKVLERCYELYPDYTHGFQALATTLYRAKEYTKLRTIVAGWVSRHPEDYESQQLLREIESVDPTLDTIEGH
jgi:tetratricopeptide (TPR) repeat protein